MIINSSDYGEIDKRVLWPIAFKALGDDIHYGNSLLIEDGSKEPELFRGCAWIIAYQYTNDREFFQVSSRMQDVSSNLSKEIWKCCENLLKQTD